MMVRYQYLKIPIQESFRTLEMDWLKLSDDEWKQIGYLIDMTKPFALWTTLLSQSKGPTIQLVFAVFNQLLDIIETAKSKLQHKTTQWKKVLYQGLTKAESKLRKYYAQTTGTLGHLYGHAILLDPNLKPGFFRTRHWTDDFGDSDENWEEFYWESLKDLYKHSYKDIQVDTSASQINTSAALNNAYSLLTRDWKEHSQQEQFDDDKDSEIARWRQFGETENMVVIW